MDSNCSVPLENIAEKLTPISWDILDILNKNESLNFKQLNERLELRAEKLSKELTRLEGGCLIICKRKFTDFRKLEIKISNFGLDIIKIKHIYEQ